MVFEMAEIAVKPGEEAAFEDGVRRAAHLFEAARGYVSFALHHVVETPGTYRLVVGWETVEHHMADFRNSPAFQEWRAIVGQYFASPPKVDHTSVVFEAA
jgi:heme-degrading monooxygenase HmoA